MGPDNVPAPMDRSHRLSDTVPVSVCGVPVHALTLAESIAAADELIADGRPHQHVSVNAAKIVRAQRDSELARIIRSCELVNADGQAVVWAGRMLGRPLPERVTGIDFMLALWERAARERYRVFLLGAEPAVVRRVAAIATSRGVDVVGYRDGYWSDEQEPKVVAAVRAARPDLLFLAVPTPRKEYFLARHLTDLNCGLAVGVGGSFDVVAGIRARAPRWMRRVGLEWSFRLMQEPRRLFVRYLIGNTAFVLLVLRDVVMQRKTHR